MRPVSDNGYAAFSALRPLPDPAPDKPAAGTGSRSPGASGRAVNGGAILGHGSGGVGLELHPGRLKLFVDLFISLTGGH